MTDSEDELCEKFLSLNVRSESDKKISSLENIKRKRHFLLDSPPKRENNLNINAIMCGQNSEALNSIITGCRQQDEKFIKKEQVLEDVSDCKKNAVKENASKIIYYALAVPKEVNAGKPIIFTTKQDVLSALKKYPFARFRSFESIDEAENFSCLNENSEKEKSVCISEDPSQSAASKEKVYKSISSLEFVKLRKIIESGDLSKFLQEIWSNPRYLISNFDGPTILQEGTRYNALHVAARNKQSSIFAAVLQTLQNLKFYELLYDDPSTMMRQSVEHVIDLYLNMPDKALAETPLHFASKFGASDIVKMLLVHPACDKSKKNKYGLTAEEIICQRAVDQSQKCKIQKLFEQTYYVPLLRDINKLNEAFIGKPCPAEDINKLYSVQPGHVHKLDFLCCALAGPVSLDEAKNFYTVWQKKKFTTFTEQEQKILKEISLTDSEKGLERIGRVLAKALSIDWIEFWPDLEMWYNFNDLSSLENHLKLRARLLMLSSVFRDKMTPGDVNHNDSGINKKCSLTTSFSFERHLSSTSSLETDCTLLFNLINDFLEELSQYLDSIAEKIKCIEASLYTIFKCFLPHMMILTDISFTNDNEISSLHEELGHLLYLKCSKLEKDFLPFVKYLLFQFNINNSIPFKSICKLEHLCCILRYFVFHYLFHNGVAAIKIPQCTCYFLKKDCNIYYSASELYYLLLKARQSLFNELCLEDEQEFFDLEKLDEGGDIPSIKLSKLAIEEPLEDDVLFSLNLNKPQSLPQNINNEKFSNSGKNSNNKHISTSYNFNIDNILEKDFFTVLTSIPLTNKELIAFHQFAQSVSKFCESFICAVEKILYNIPFRKNINFFATFSETICFLEDVRNCNFSPNSEIYFLHSDIAEIIYTRIKTIFTKNDLKILKNFLSDHKEYETFDLIKSGINNLSEWMHLRCMINYIYLLIKFSSFYEKETICNCNWIIADGTTDGGMNVILCRNILKAILKKNDCSYISEAQSSNPESKDELEVFFTPPESPVDFSVCTPAAAVKFSAFQDVFLNGYDLSNTDIDVFRAIEYIDVDPEAYPLVFRYKTLIQEKLGSLWKPDSVISGTPTSSSRSVTRALKEMPKHDSIRRTLF